MWILQSSRISNRNIRELLSLYSSPHSKQLAIYHVLCWYCAKHLCWFGHGPDSNLGCTLSKKWLMTSRFELRVLFLAVIQIALIINKQHGVLAPTLELDRLWDNVQISHQVGKPQLPPHGPQEVLQIVKAYHRQKPMMNVFLIINSTCILCI